MFVPVKLEVFPGKDFEDVEQVSKTSNFKNLEKSSLQLHPELSTILTSTSLVSTLILLYFIQKNERISSNPRSTPLPGWGILGDRVNELIEIFLDTLAVYVHNDDQWNNCPQRLLCEANQRAVDYGTFYGVLTYLSSLFVSFWLQNRRVTSSMEAMRKGRQGQNCIQQYPCPFSL